MSHGLDDPRLTRLATALQTRHRFRGRVGRSVATLACVVPAVRGRVLAGVPELRLAPSGTAAGERMASKYSGRRHGVPRRLAVSVLTIPSDPAQYTRGRPRQALRTNSRRAREAGVVCRRIDAAEAGPQLEALLTARGEHEVVPLVEHDLAEGLCTVWVAEAADGVVEAAALTSRDGDFARLDLMVSAPDRESFPARYLLSAHLVAELGAAGVRHLAVDSALFLREGLRQFQQRLGFEPTTLTLVAPPRPARPAPTRRPALLPTLAASRM